MKSWGTIVRKAQTILVLVLASAVFCVAGYQLKACSTCGGCKQPLGPEGEVVVSNKPDAAPKQCTEDKCSDTTPDGNLSVGDKDVPRLNNLADCYFKYIQGKGKQLRDKITIQPKWGTLAGPGNNYIDYVPDDVGSFTMNWGTIYSPDTNWLQSLNQNVDYWCWSWPAQVSRNAASSGYLDGRRTLMSNGGHVVIPTNRNDPPEHVEYGYAAMDAYFQVNYNVVGEVSEFAWADMWGTDASHWYFTSDPVSFNSDDLPSDQSEWSLPIPLYYVTRSRSWEADDVLSTNWNSNTGKLSVAGVGVQYWNGGNPIAIYEFIDGDSYVPPDGSPSEIKITLHPYENDSCYVYYDAKTTKAGSGGNSATGEQGVSRQSTRTTQTADIDTDNFIRILTCTTKDPSGNVISSTKDFRCYYDNNSSDDIKGKLKYVIGQASTAMLIAQNGADYVPPDEDTFAANYDKYYEYWESGNSEGQLAGTVKKITTSCASCGTSGLYAYGQSSPLPADEGKLDRWKYKKAEDTRDSSGKGLVTTYYYNAGNALVHKQVDAYGVVNGNVGLVGTSHYHNVLDSTGKLTAEYTPENISSCAFNADGTFTLSLDANHPRRLCEYDSTTGLLKYEKVGTDLATARIVTAYEYYNCYFNSSTGSGITRTDLLKRVIRYQDDQTNGSDGEVTEYFYHLDETTGNVVADDSLTSADFYDGLTAWQPYQRLTRVVLDAASGKYLDTTEVYASDGSVTSMKDPNGTATSYEYNAYTPSGDKLMSRSIQDSGTGHLGLTTDYTYDSSTGRLVKTTSPDSTTQSDSQSAYYTRTRYSTLVTYDFYIIDDNHRYPSVNVIEERSYPHIDSSGNVQGPVEITYSVDGGPVISRQTWCIPTQSLSSGVIAAPTPLTSQYYCTLQACTDYVYDKDQLTATRTYYDAANLDLDHALETSYTYYPDGRTKTVTAPDGTVTYYFCGWVQNGSSCVQEDRTYQVYSVSGTYHLAAPVDVTWTDSVGRTVRTWTGSYTGTSEPTGAETLTELSRTAYTYDVLGRQIETWTYFNLGSLALNQDGTEGTNYYKAKTLAYDNQDRVLRSQDANGKITAFVYDNAGRVVSTWQGTSCTDATRTDPNPSGTSNDLWAVSKSFYDANKDGTGNQRSYVTRQWSVASIAESTGQPDGSSITDYRWVDYSAPYATETINSTLTWVRWTKPQTGPWTKEILDRAGRTTETQTYYYDTGTSADVLCSKSTSTYTFGRLTSSNKYSVVNGTAGDSLLTTYDYEAGGRVCKVTPPTDANTPNVYTKTGYDLAGRTIWQAQCSAEGINPSPDTLADDTIERVTVNVYDSKGRLSQTQLGTSLDNAQIVSINRYDTNGDGTGTAIPILMGVSSVKASASLTGCGYLVVAS